MHLRVQVKKDERVPYYNYLKWHSIHLQGICDANKAFTDVFVGWPGRAHDSMVWKNSPIKQELPQLLHVTGRTLINTYHIVADSAYPCTNNVMTAFKAYGNRLGEDRKKFNRNLSSKRNCIERAFKLLVQRFPRLRILRCTKMKRNIDLSLAACVLHNWCIMADDTDVSLFPEQHIVLHAANARTAAQVGIPNSTSGNAKRNLLVDRIARRH